MTASAMADQGGMVVARFLDGRVLKGTTHDFAPNKTEFHLHEMGDERAKAVPVSTSSLKALFFVKSYEGDPSHEDDDSCEQASNQGRRMRVRFVDGEELVGQTMGYNPQKQGFFLVPADRESNNTRVFVLQGAVANIEWL